MTNFKYTMLLILIFMLKFCYVYTFSQDNLSTKFGITSSPVNDLVLADDNIDITGNIPVLTFHENDQFKNLLNNAIINIYKRVITQNKNYKYNRSINFIYKITNSNNIISIIINTTVTSSTTKHEKTSITYDNLSGKILYINDLIGPNGIKIANSVIKNELATNPNNYNINFKGITKNQPFYVDKNVLSVIYSHTPFEIDMKRIINYYPTDFFKKQTYDLKMISLRESCEAFGFHIKWNAKDTSIEVSKDDFVTSFVINKNSYKIGSLGNKTLESPPIMKDGKTYVPISFFEHILEISYSIQNDEIIFSAYY